MTFPRLLVISLLISITSATAEVIIPTHAFTDINATLIGIEQGDVVWGDYDNDGYLDLVVTGRTGPTELYRYDFTNSTFTLSSGLTDVKYGSLEFGDFDNDNKVDLLLMGSRGTQPDLFINPNVGGGFDGTIKRLWYGSGGDAARADFDGDGDLDVAFFGQSGSTLAFLFRNEGNFNFTELDVGWEGMTNGAIAWGDYDNDGDPDLVVTGLNPSSVPITKLYRNDGYGQFTDVGAGLEAVSYSSVAWGDYDADGDLDLLLTGKDVNAAGKSIIYENTAGSFTDIGAGLPGVYAAEAAWGDYDNDGDLDIVVVGSGVAEVWENTGSDVFTLDSDVSAVLPGITNADVAWGDYDGDGDLDLVMGGDSAGTDITRIFNNNMSDILTNVGPSQPTNLTATVAGASVALSWDASTDYNALTPSAGLTYNIRIGTATAGNDIMSGMQDDAVNIKLLPEMGNVGQDTSFTIRNLDAGTYYWSVEGVDNNFEMGLWSTEATFNVTLAPPTSIAAVTDTHKVDLSWTAATDAVGYRVYRDTVSIVIGQYTPVDSTTATGYSFTGLQNNRTYYFRVASVDANGFSSKLSDEIVATPYLAGIDGGLPQVNGAVAWGDFDNDGEMDVAIAGLAADMTRVSAIYRNVGDGIFTDISTGLPGLSASSVDWGDYDNDGDLDLVLTGEDLSGNFTLIYRNDANLFNDGPPFIDIGAGLTGVRYGNAIWVDADADGDLDIALSGLITGGSIAVLAVNDNGVFTEQTEGFPTILNWGDYDNDGDLDYLNGSSIMRNDNEIYTDIGANLAGSMAEWGDFDNDGDLDVLTSGPDTTLIYRNDGNDTFVGLDLGLRDLNPSSMAWGDYDSDGDLDWMLSGIAGTDYLTWIYTNNFAAATNTLPTPPGTLTTVEELGGVTFSWSAGTDSETPAAGLSYNLRIGTTPGAADILYPESDLTTGKLLEPKMGNVKADTGWTFKGFPADGTYYWSVQSVDAAYGASAFAAEQSVVVVQVPPAPTALYVGYSIVSGNMELTWTQNTDPSVTGYRVYGGTTSPPTTILDSTASISDTTITLAGLQRRITHYFRVTAVDAAGIESDYSPEVGKSVPNFEEVPRGIQAISGDIAWGDYDADGDLDILLTGDDAAGAYQSLLYRNDWTSYTELDLALPDGSTGAEWGDYDNDGDLDFAIFYNSLVNIYRNDGTDTFVALAAPLPLSSGSFLDWGDADNDGDLDLLVSNKIFANMGNDQFVEVATDIPDVSTVAGEWGDYDNDGDLDLFIINYQAVTSNTYYYARVYRNDGGFNFTETALFHSGSGGGAWGDYDSDGDLDLIFSGLTVVSEKITGLVRNDNGTFVLLPTEINVYPTYSNHWTRVAWGDYDNDGDLDLLGDGYPTGIDLFRNNGDDTFTDMPTDMPTSAYGDVAWGDFDNDSDLDLLVSVNGYPVGGGSKQDIAGVFTNLAALTANTAPAAPSTLTTAAVIGGTQLSWAPGTDSETQAAGLTYNLRVGSTVGGYDIMSAQSGLGSNDPQVPGRGNVDHNTSWRINVPSDGEYHWSVQAVDAGFAGSAFATGQMFTGYATPATPKGLGLALQAIPGGIALNWTSSPDAAGYYIYGGTSDNPTGRMDSTGSGTDTTIVLTNIDWGNTYYFRVSGISASGHEGLASQTDSISTPSFLLHSSGIVNDEYSDGAWADYDNDGDLDIVLCGSTDATRLYNNNNGIFTIVDAGFPAVVKGSVDWGDYDNDGDLDLALTGDSTGVYITRIFENTAGSFARIGAGLAGVSYGSADWGDYDNDGDLDIVVTGRQGQYTGGFSMLYRNDNGLFVETDVTLVAQSEGESAWGDYDNDGDLDLVMSGNSISSYATYLYTNSAGQFNETQLLFRGAASINWGDYDNDGDLDLLLPQTVLRNDQGTFVDLNTTMTTSNWTTAAWGDYDNDGDLDILSEARLYRNDGSDTFTAITPDLGTIDYNYDWRTTLWADFDNDGDLDPLVAGETYSTLSLYLNMEAGSPNNAPTAPGGLTATNSSAGLMMSWNRATDVETPTNALSYNLRVGTTSGGSDIFSSESDATTGYRLVPEIGNVSQDTSWSLSGLPEGNVYWSVQAVDNSYAGSAFSGEFIFDYRMVPDVPLGLAVAPGDGEATLTWRKGSTQDFQKYFIYADTSATPGAPVDSITAISDTTIMVSNLINGWEYNFWVTQVDSQGDESEFASPATGIPSGPPVWSLPATLVFLEDDSLKLDLDTLITDDTHHDSVMTISYAGGGNVSVLIDQATHLAVFTAWPDFFGLDTLVFTATDPYALAGKDTVVVTVTGVNDKPLAVNDTITIQEDETLFMQALMNDIDVDGDDLSIGEIWAPTSGSATIQGDSIVYTPDANYFGADTILYAVDDNQGGKDTATIFVTITSFNDPPEILAMAPWIFPEDSQFQIDLDSLVFDPDDDTSNISWSAIVLASSQSSAPRSKQLVGKSDPGIRAGSESKLAGRESMVYLPQMLLTEQPGKAIQFAEKGSRLESDSGRPSREGSVRPQFYATTLPASDEMAVLERTNSNVAAVNGVPGELVIDIDQLSHVVTISGTQDYFASNLKVQLRATDAAGTWGQDTIIVSITPVNDAPNPFALLTPDNNAILDENYFQVNGDSLRFSWDQAVDVDLDDLTYTWHLEGPDIDSVLTGLTGYQVAVHRSVIRSDVQYVWYVEAADNDTTTSCISRFYIYTQTLNIDQANLIPTEFALHPAYPNPFNPSANIRFDLPEAGDVTLLVYDLLGREVIRLEDSYMQAGYFHVVWNGRAADGRSVPSGMYFARLVAPEYSKTIKMVLLK